MVAGKGKTQNRATFHGELKATAIGKHDRPHQRSAIEFSRRASVGVEIIDAPDGAGSRGQAVEANSSSIGQNEFDKTERDVVADDENVIGMRSADAEGAGDGIVGAV